MLNAKCKMMVSAPPIINYHVRRTYRNSSFCILNFAFKKLSTVLVECGNNICGQNLTEFYFHNPCGKGSVSTHLPVEKKLLQP